MSNVKHASVTFDFRILDEQRLLTLAEESIEKYGEGHKFDPTNLADCIVEVLLLSNPNILDFNEYGLELSETRILNPK